MKQKCKATIALVLILAMLLALAACGGSGTPGTATPPPGGITDGDGGALIDEGYVFVPEFIDLTLPGALWIQIAGLAGDTLYLQYSAVDDNFNSIATLATVRTDGSGLREFWSGRSEMWEEDGRSHQEFAGIQAAMLRPDGGLLAVRNEHSSFWSETEWGFAENLYLMAFAADGTEEREVNLTELLGGDPEMGFGIGRTQMMSDGRVLIGTWDTLYVLTPDWTVQSTIPWDNIQDFIVTKDDQILVSDWDTENNRDRTRLFDLATGGIPEENGSLFEAGLSSAVVGTDYDLYVGVMQSVYGFDLGTGRATRLFDWLDMDMVSPPQRFTVAETGEIYFFEERFDEMTGGRGGNASLIRLVKRDASEIPARTELVYGALRVDHTIRREIVEFNRRNSDFRIRVREYMDWRDWDTTAAINRLNTDIMTGNAPDILDFGVGFGSNLPFEHYARRGFLVDLGALLEQDAGLNRSDILGSFLDLLTLDGSLYTITSSFTVQTLAARTDRVGPDMGWTMEEFETMVHALPPGAVPFDQWMTRQRFMTQILSANLGLFLDRDTGRAHFDSPLFEAYLEFAATLQTDEDVWGGDGGLGSPGGWARPLLPVGTAVRPLSARTAAVSEARVAMPAPPIGSLPGDGWDNPFATGQVALMEANLWGFESIVNVREQFGGPVTLIGYPSEVGIGSVMAPWNLLGISATSSHPEAAWSFIRTLLTEDFQRANQSGFATNLTVLAEQQTRALEMGDQNQGGWPEMPVMPEVDPIDVEDEGEEMPPVDDFFPPAADWAPTQAEVDQVMALLERLDLLFMWDTTVVEMVEEETLAFFAGDRSLADTVRMIQNRVQTHLNERG